MSRRWKVEWAEVAVRDLERLVDFIAEDSPVHASRVLDRLEHAAAALKRYPLRGRRVPELRLLETTAIREVVVAPWRLVYRVGKTQVLVMGIFDSRRDLEHALLARVAT